MLNKTKKENITIIGRPNVGKSSLFNRLIGKRKALILKDAGTTRDFIKETIKIGDKEYNLYDTAGYLESTDEEISQKALKKLEEIIKITDKFLFVVDGKVPPTIEDKKIADLLRKIGKKVILVINKTDNGLSQFEKEYYHFGFSDIFKTSAIHNLGLNELKAAIFNEVKPKAKAKNPKNITTKERMIKVAILGRPNVGKSSLLNALTGKERSIVTDIPGTTRDTIEERISIREYETEVIDTAGIRRPGKIGKEYKRKKPLEKFSFLRTKKAIENADIALIVIDASEKRATTRDLAIAGAAKEMGKGIILIINKWDLVSGITQEEFLNHLRNRFRFMIWVPAIFVSAKTGRNIEKIKDLIIKVYQNYNRQIQTAKLNRILESFLDSNLPSSRGNKKPKIFYAIQIKAAPPTFEIRAKYQKKINVSWKRAFINELRRHYDFTGVPIRIEFKRSR